MLIYYCVVLGTAVTTLLPISCSNVWLTSFERINQPHDQVKIVPEILS